MKRYVLRFFRKEARLSQDFSVVGSSFQIMGAATEKALVQIKDDMMGMGIIRVDGLGPTEGTFLPVIYHYSPSRLMCYSLYVYTE